MDYRKMGKVEYIMNKPDNMDTVERLRVLAERKGCTPGQLALAWLHNQGKRLLGDAGFATIPGTTNLDHIRENVKALETARSLSEAEMLEIEKAVPQQLTGEDGTVYQRYGADTKEFRRENKEPPLP